MTSSGWASSAQSRHGNQFELTEAHREALEVLAEAGCTYRDGTRCGSGSRRTEAEEWDDLVRGRVTVCNGDIGDPVLVRSSGRPTFHLASTVDDIADAVTHIVRHRADAAGDRRSATHLAGAWRPSLGRPVTLRPSPGPGGSPIRVGTGEGTIRSLARAGTSPVPLLIYLAVPRPQLEGPPAGLDDHRRRT